MKLKLLLFICVVFFINNVQAQTFNGTGGSIPDSGAVYGIYPVTVTGIGNINNTYGVSAVCLNINHTWVSDLEIYLQAPDGTMIALSIQNGGSGQNYTGTCFQGTTGIPVADGTAPFTGNFRPDDYMGAANNGQNADGIWKLIIKDIYSGDIGSLLSWSITFSNSLPPAPPVCNGNPPPGNTCFNTTAICSFSGFCASTSQSYSADSWPELDYAFCGTVQNNAFTKFVATTATMDFSIWVTSSTNHDGIQMFFFDGGCGSGPVVDYGCYSPIRPGSSPNIITASGLTPGNIYYLMIDGYAGDECNYVVELYPPANGLAVTASAPAVCRGGSVQLTATGGSGSYTWTGPGLNSTTGNTVVAMPPDTTTYSVSSIDPGGICPITKQVTVNVIPLPSPPATSSDTIVYCQHSTTIPLTATGSNLLWYNSLTGGPGSTVAPSPPTSIPGLTTYYVSQTGACESERVAINILVKPSPDLGADKSKAICFETSTDLTGEFNPGNLIQNWTFGGTSILPPHDVSVTGSYQLKVTNNDGCSDSAVIHLVVQPEYHPLIYGDTLAIKGISFQLHCTPASTYSWSPSALLNAANIQSPVAVITTDQQFIVEAVDALGCRGTDSVMVKIYNGIRYYVPNAFSPNGDGVNDIFRAIPVGIDHTEVFMVLNRYGKPIFQTSDPYRKGWNGTYLGVKQSPGTYIWFIKGIDKNGKKVEMRGTVILVL